MARFDKGWVKIHRKAILGDIGSNYIRGGLFQTLICIANLQESTVSWKGSPRKLGRGELVTSIGELAALGEVDRKSVIRHLNYLVQRETITVEKCFGGTLIKIPNFDKYQVVDAEGSQMSPISGDSDVPIEGTHIKEEKKERRKEININPSFDLVLKSYLELRGTIQGASARQRYESQIKGAEAHDDLVKAIKNYSAMLAANPWRNPKSTFATFLGTKKSGFFWRDYIDVTTLSTKPAAELPDTYFDPEPEIA